MKQKMQNRYARIAACVLPAMMFIVSNVAVVTPVHAAGVYFKCNSGYKLEVRGGGNPTGARCFKKGKENRVQPNAGCPVGTTFNVDYVGKTDYCLPLTGSLTSKFRAKCGPGQKKRVRGGGDRCYKVTKSKITIVNKPG